MNHASIAMEQRLSDRASSERPEQQKNPACRPNNVFLTASPSGRLELADTPSCEVLLGGCSYLSIYIRGNDIKQKKTHLEKLQSQRQPKLD